MERINNSPTLPTRDPTGYKGTFGKVCVIGGSCGDHPMIGAPALAARAALRSGCGLCTVAVPAPILPAVLSIIPAATGVALPIDASQHLFAAGCAHVIDEALINADALVVGPGFGRDQAQQQIVIRLASAFTKPLVLDADALRALAHTPDFARDLQASIIMTPHAGEFAALAHALELDLDPVTESTREVAVTTLAARLGCIVVLKGAHTQVSDGVRVWRSEFAEAALAIGVAPGQFVAIVAIAQLSESLQHANLRVWFGAWGERLLVSPRFHRLHHGIGIGHESRPAGQVNAPAVLGGHNFGVLFPWWDMLFGTADFTVQFAPTGVRNQVEQGVDYGHGFWSQQWRGLQRLWTRP